MLKEKFEKSLTLYNLTNWCKRVEGDYKWENAKKDKIN